MAILVPIGGPNATRQGAEMVAAMQAVGDARNKILAVGGRAGSLLSASDITAVKELFGLADEATAGALMLMFARLADLPLLDEINRIIPV